MDEKRDYYEILGISRNATPDEIKHAYRNLARQYHPDIAEDKARAEEHFKEINEAFAVLSNPEKRARYDRFGREAFEGAGAQGFGVDFSQGFDVFDDLIGAFFGETRRRGREEAQGADLRVDLEVSLEEAFTGITREITADAMQACPDCGGTGAGSGGFETCSACRGHGQIKQVQQSFFGRVVRTTACVRCGGTGQFVKDPCHSCRGTGRVNGSRKLRVEIPAGVEDGNRIRLRGEGEPGLRGAPAGDLYLFLHVKPHPHFKREGLNVIYNLSVSFPEAVLGNEVEVPTLSGSEKLHVPPGSGHGDVLRLKGKGMPNLSGGARGDQYVVVKVEVPKKISEKQRTLLLELARMWGVKIREEKGFMGRVKDALGG